MGKIAYPFFFKSWKTQTFLKKYLTTIYFWNQKNNYYMEQLDF